jgi:hypothetical protein
MSVIFCLWLISLLTLPRELMVLERWRRQSRDPADLGMQSCVNLWKLPILYHLDAFDLTF